MRKYFKNKKMISLTVSLLATTLILTGTFAWSVRLFSTTGGLGEDYHYIVKLLDIDTDPLFVINKWDSEKLDKKVYATSSYKVEDIAKQYDDIMDKDSNSIFRNTWVRIKLEETLMRNGSTKTDIVTELDSGKLISSFDKYFSLDSNGVDMITLDTWIDNQETPDYEMHGRFWILDTTTGWLYWAQPLLATTVVDGSNPELADQTTDHIIDEVSLIKQPAGVWEYTIKATLEAMDVELQGYTEEGAWSDITETDPLYELFAIEDALPITATYFPDITFRTWLTSNVAVASDGKLTASELKTITTLDISNKGISDVTGLEYFTSLTSLDVSKNHLTYLDVTALTKLNKTNGTSFKYNPQYEADGETELTQTNNSENVKEWEEEGPQYDEYGNLLFNEHNFPDAAFRVYLEETTGKTAGEFLPSYIVGGKISKSNLENVIKIDVRNNTSISNLKGLEHFTNLATLYANSMPNLTSLDVSKNEALTRLDVCNNLLLRKLDVSKNEALITLFVTNNPKLSSLYVSENVALKDLEANGNTSLTSLTLGSKPNLINLRVQNCQLSTLDISGIPSIFKGNWPTDRYQTQWKDAEMSGTRTSQVVDAGTQTITWQ